MVLIQEKTDIKILFDLYNYVVYQKNGNIYTLRKDFDLKTETITDFENENPNLLEWVENAHQQLEEENIFEDYILESFSQKNFQNRFLPIIDFANETGIYYHIVAIHPNYPHIEFAFFTPEKSSVRIHYFESVIQIQKNPHYKDFIDCKNSNLPIAYLQNVFIDME